MEGMLKCENERKEGEEEENEEVGERGVNGMEWDEDKRLLFSIQ